MPLGTRYGRLVIIERDTSFSEGQYRWRCKCDCGSEKSVPGSHLRSGFVRSCGCLRREHASQMQSPPPPKKEIGGMTFGRLSVVEFAEKRGVRHFWRCLCVCGTEAIVDISKLTGGTTVSCGCFRRESSSRRGHAILGHKRGDQHPRWNPTLTAWDRRHKRDPEAQIWKRDVIKRDGARCIACGATGAVAAHHLRSYTLHPDIRHDLENGVTVCVHCHRAYHSHVGRTDFTRESFFEFFGITQPA